MKIKLFIWLVEHKKILTWENLWKKVLSDPSKCQLCESQEETMEHLLNLCPYTSIVWNGIASIFKQTNGGMGSITYTLKKWRKNFFEYDIVNKAWASAPGFLIWDVSKECNNRIFKNKKGSSHSIMEIFLRQLKDMVGTLIQKPPENQPSNDDVQILLYLGMWGLIPQGNNKNIKHIIADRDF